MSNYEANLDVKHIFHTSYKIYSNKLSCIAGMLLFMIIVGIVMGLFGATLRMLFSSIAPNTLRLLSQVFNFVFTAPLTAGLAYTYLNVVRNNEFNYTLILCGFGKFFKSIFTYFLFGISIIIGIACLVLPGIYILIRFSLVYLLVVDSNENTIDSFRLSWNYTNGKTFKLFKNFSLLLLLYLTIFLLPYLLPLPRLSILISFFNIILLTPFVFIFTAVIYEELRWEYSKKNITITPA